MMGRGGGEGGKVPNRECLIGQVGQVRRVRQVGRPSDAGATTNRTSSRRSYWVMGCWGRVTEGWRRGA